MKKINKMLVVLPLVLVFVLGSLPVFAWPAKNAALVLTLTEAKAGISVTSKMTDYNVFIPADPWQTKGMVPATDYEAIVSKMVEGTLFEADYKAGLLKLDKDSITALKTEFDGTATGKLTLNFEREEKTEESKPKEEKKSDLKRCIALDKLTGEVVWTEMAQISNKNGAASWHDMANEFYSWEVARGNKLKDYYLLGHAPDINNSVSEHEAKLMKDLNVDLIIWVVEKVQPLRVTHVFPDRDPLFETIGVDYFVLTNNQINNYNAAEYAKTRIQKMNEMGYVFEKAEYVPFTERSGLLKEARDAYGRKLPVDLVLKGNGIFIYYKGAPVPAPVVDSQKKVDAASAQTAPQTVVNNVQANVQTPAAPVTAAGQQLPATGVADNAFLFLSSAALMALGIFFFKKH